MGTALEFFNRYLMPFAAMVMVVCGEVGTSTIVKLVMTSGMNDYVYIVYYHILGTFMLLPFFIFHRYRSRPPPVTFPILCRFFVLGLLGSLLWLFSYEGIGYSSPTLAASIGNIMPAITFLLAIIFRMEKLDLTDSSGQAKSLGTMVSISGALMATLYKGPAILMDSSPSKSVHQVLLSRKSNWVLGGLLIAAACLTSATWNIAQAATIKIYPDKMTINFFYVFFGTVQCAILSLIAERDPSAWRLQPGIQMIAIVYSAIFSSLIRISVITWCLQKKGPVYVVLFQPMNVVIAAVSSYMFLGEVLHLGSVIGAIIIVVGFFMVMWGQAKEVNMVQDNASCHVESSTQKTPLLQGSTTEQI